MTEEEWLVCTDPTPMLEFLQGKATQRGLQCVVLECCRVLAPIYGNDTTRQMVDIAERFIDKTAAVGVVERLRYDTRNALLLTDSDDANIAHQYLLADDLTPGKVGFALESTASAISVSPMGEQWNRGSASACQAATLRCIFGNPFRPVTADPRWLTSTAVALAQAIYDERAFDRLPILADALEEAGCDEPTLLGHCRSDGPHVRGCWAVDLVLGKM